MILAAAYLRRSTTKQEASLDGQREAVQSFAKQHGYTVAREYVDDGISGATGDARPAFQQMIHDAGNGGGFKAVLAYDMSRFGRMDADETGHFRYLLRKVGVRVVFTDENDGGDSDAGEILRPVLAMQKREYLKQLSRDVLRGMVQSFKDGWISGRAAPFGYDRILIDEAGAIRARMKRGEKTAKPRSWHVSLAISDTPGEADAVRWVFETYTTCAVGLASLARQLNEKGLKSPSGGLWCLGTLREMIKNPVYRGVVTFGRRALGAFHRLNDGQIEKADKYTQQIEDKPEDTWITQDRPDLRLVSDEMWNKANSLMRSRGTMQGRAFNRRTEFALSGLLTCGDCGAFMFAWNRKTGASYGCSTHHKRRGCQYNVVRAEAMTDVVRDVVKRTVEGQGLERLRRAVVTAASMKPQTPVDDIEGQVRQARVEYDRAASNLLSADPEDLPMLNEKLRSLRSRVQELEGRVRQTQQDDPSTVAGAVCERAQGMLEDLFTTTGGRLKGVLRELVDHIELTFGWGTWGQRQVRVVTGGTVFIRTAVTTGNRGGRI
jgi:DNA invertase Pin-like site-specific DNA recombinase